MSQFRDTFTKEEQREPLLDYDDSAFLFYLCTVGFCTLAPWTFICLRRLLSPQRRLARLYPEKTRSGAVLVHCCCSLCNEKRAAELEQQRSSSSRFLRAFWRPFSLLLPFPRKQAEGRLHASSARTGSSSSSPVASSSSSPVASSSSKKKQPQQQQHAPHAAAGATSENSTEENQSRTENQHRSNSPAAGGMSKGTAAAAAAAAKHNSSSQVRKRFRAKGLSWWDVLEKVLLLLGWVGLATLCCDLPEMKNLKTFDPFDILELEAGASNRDIKKAYRLMSLRYHPDRNANDPTSAAKFILVSKAYQALTDPTAKANYEKYGNPDGPGNMKVGMGLPRFLVEEKYQLLVLACFFLFLLVLLPMAFICYYQRQKKYAPNGVLVETLQFLTHYMTEGSRLKNCPEYLAASGESRALKIEKADDAEMQPIIQQAIEPKKRSLNNPVIVRNYFLILGHMQRLHDRMTERLRDVLDELLKDALPITHCMLEICVLSDWLHAARAMLEFRRCLIQGLDGRSSTLLQIPHFTAELVRHCHRGKNAARELSEFLRQDADERKGLLEMTADEQMDVQAFVRSVSQLKINASVSVEDEEDIVVGDIATCHIDLTRMNLKEGEAAGAVHAPLLPVPKYEEWWIFLVDKTEAASTGGRILNFHRTRSLERVVEEKIQFRVSKGGKQSITVLALCDSYAGCDSAIEVEFRAYSPEEKPRDVWVHPDDVRLDEEPTLFQQMLGDMYNSSDEEEVFDLEEGSKVTVKKKAAEAAAAATAAAAVTAAAGGGPAAAAAAAASGTAAAAEETKETGDKGEEEASPQEGSQQQEKSKRKQETCEAATAGGGKEKKNQTQQQQSATSEVSSSVEQQQQQQQQKEQQQHVQQHLQQQQQLQEEAPLLPSGCTSGIVTAAS